MNFDLNVNWNEVEEIGFKPLPAGSYAGKVTGVVLKDTKSKTGKYIKLEFTLMGEHVGKRKIFHNINIKNDNEQAVKIGLGTLKKLLVTAGLNPEEFTDTQMLNGAIVGLKVTVRNSDEYGEQNEVKDFIPFEDDLLSAYAPDEVSF